MAKVREAAGHRVASGVDYLSIGQDEMNEAEIAPIIGQFVDEERARRFAFYSRVFDVSLSECPDLFGRQLLHHSWICRCLVLPVPRDQGLNNMRDVGQFRRAFDLRMACENLLDKRGAGARHAKSDDGRGERRRRAKTIDTHMSPFFPFMTVILPQKK